MTTKKIYANGRKSVLIPVLSSIAIYTKGVTSVKAPYGNPNVPPDYQEVGPVSNTETVFGPYDIPTTLIIEADQDGALYEVAVTPAVSDTATGLAGRLSSVVKVAGSTVATWVAAGLKFATGGAILGSDGSPAATIAADGTMTIAEILGLLKDLKFATDKGILGSDGSPAATVAADGTITIAEILNLTKDLQLATGKGISFDPYAAGNLFDDYEFGTFTPSVFDAAAAGNEATYTDRTGTYVKIGKVVHIAIFMDIAGTAGMIGANDAWMLGLPFVAADIGGGTSQPLSFAGNAITFTGNVTYGVRASSANALLLETVSNTAIDSVIVSELGTGYFNVCGAYLTS